MSNATASPAPTPSAAKPPAALAALASRYSRSRKVSPSRIPGRASPMGNRAAEELDESLRARPGHLLRDEMAAVESDLAHVVGPFLPDRKRRRRLAGEISAPPLHQN